jgi:hypothetical protein
MSARPFEVVLADVDGDGETDLLGATQDSVTGRLRRGRGQA